MTLPADLAARPKCSSARPADRADGIGHDSHPFGPGHAARLGGIEIAGAPRLHGHSDGDVALHAVADALLGAAALGDLGRLFPADARTRRGIASAELLARGPRAAREARLAAAGVDLTVIARPAAARRRTSTRCAPRSRACSVLDRSRSASRRRPGNLDGAEGAGRAISRARHRHRSRRVRMTLRLHDTLTGETRPLVPLRDGHVGIYSCGPTVYGPAHIGNFRSFLFADLLVRHLRWRGLRVTWVMNITDIDDKIIRGAAATGERIETLADRWLERFLADAAALRMTAPDVAAAGDRAHRARSSR